jgi:two-component system sensor histidine kinase VicK
MEFPSLPFPRVFSLFRKEHDVGPSRKTQRDDLERAKSEFVALASHQLRTPLTSIKGTLEMLRDGSPGPLTLMQIELLNRAVMSAQHMSETIGTMLTLSHLEAGKIRLRQTECAVAPLLSSIREEQEQQAQHRKQTLDVNCPPDLTLPTDERLLREIVGNLVSNALKYTPEGGHITVHAEEQPNGGVRIDVKDNGYGITSEDQSRIFGKFFRASNVQDKEAGGTGLGLYLASELTRLLGGSLTFRSAENQGTTFTLTLPQR